MEQGGRKASSLSTAFFPLGQPPQLASCHPKERGKRASLCMGVPGSATDTGPRGEKVSIIPSLSENSKPRDIAYWPHEQTKTSNARCHEPPLMREWLWTPLPSLHLPAQLEAVSTGLSSGITNQHTELT